MKLFHVFIYNFILIYLSLSFFACTSQTPADMARVYANAVDNNDASAGYEQMSDHYKNSHSFEQFKTTFGAGDNLSTELRKASKFNTIFRYPALFDMKFEHGSWAIYEPNLSFYETSTPKKTLNYLLAAAKTKQYDKMYRIIPNKIAKSISIDEFIADWTENASELEERLYLLELSKDNPIVIQPKIAWMDYAEHRIIFVIEDSIWKIASL